MVEAEVKAGLLPRPWSLSPGKCYSLLYKVKIARAIVPHKRKLIPSKAP